MRCFVAFVVLAAGCSGRVEPSSDAAAIDAARSDAAAIDAARLPDAARTDAAAVDAARTDAASVDAAAPVDVGRDAPVIDAATIDVGSDAFATDAATVDAFVTPDSNTPTFVLGAPFADCDATCAARGLTCAGPASVGADCMAHTDIPSCAAPGAWIYRHHVGEADACYTSWGTCDPCTLNYNTDNAFCCRCR
jgi:hypothetical protein